MAYIHCVTGGSGGGIPPQLQSDMDSVLNKKLGTSTSYPSTSWAKEVNLMGLLPEKTVSGAVASFADGADDVPIKTATFDIDPTLDGVSAVNVVRTGKNLFDMSFLSGDGITITDGVATGTATNFHRNFGEGLSQVFPKTRMTISFKAYTDGNASTDVQGLAVGFIYTDGTRNNITVPNNTLAYDSFSYTSASSKTVSKVSFSYSSKGSNIWHIKEVQLEIGSSATTYEPYSATTRTISLGQTVYGGSVTVDEDGECTYDDGEGNTSDLDPITPITSALGVNNIWCDTGDVETLTYRADIALALNS